jgi:hypothetical protein
MDTKKDLASKVDTPKTMLLKKLCGEYRRTCMVNNASLPPVRQMTIVIINVMQKSPS